MGFGILDSIPVLADTANIPSDAFYYGGSYYAIYHADSISEAINYCNEVGGHLATLTTKEENENVYNYAYNNGGEYAFFGFSDEKEEGKWKWVTGEEVTYTNWHIGEPNSENLEENYALFYFGDDSWNDGKMGEGSTYICEWETVHQDFSKDIDLLLGNWEGSYYANQGKTALKLEIMSVDNNGNIEAIFNFSEHPDNPGVPTGKYIMTGTYNFLTKKISLTGNEWSIHPSGYELLKVNADIDTERLIISGETVSDTDVYPDLYLIKAGTEGEETVTPPAPDEYIPVNEFLKSKYQADTYLTLTYLNNDSMRKASETVFDSISPSKKLYQVGIDTGEYAYITFWKAYTSFMSEVSDPSTAADIICENKDMYSALIYNLLECNSRVDCLSFISTKIGDKANSIYGKLKNCETISLYLDAYENMNVSQWSDEDKEELLKATKELVGEEYGQIESLSQIFSYGTQLFNYVGDFNDWCTYVSKGIELCRMSDQVKDVVEDMYSHADFLQNPDLYYALADIRDTMNSSQSEFVAKMVSNLGAVAAKDMIQFFVSSFWKDMKAQIAIKYPYTMILWASYSISEMITTSLTSADKIAEEYCRMEAIQNIRSLVKQVYQDKVREYENDKSEYSASVMNAAVDLMFDCVDLDCECASDFLDSVEGATLTQIKNFYSSNNLYELQTQITSIRDDVNSIKVKFDYEWITTMKDEYPNYYPSYSSLYKKDIKGSDITLSSTNLLYTGSKLTPSVSVRYEGNKLYEDTDYTVVYRNNTKRGVGLVTVTGCGDFAGRTTRLFNINNQSMINLNDCTAVLDVNIYTYTGKKIIPKITVKYKNAVLTSGADYKITYTNNKNVGVGSVTITGKGDFSGTLTRYFTISKAKQTLSVTTKSVTVKKKAIEKKNKTIKVMKGVKGAKGKITYKKSSGSPKITINTKSGKVTLRKGIKSGKYTVVVNLVAAETSNYAKASKKVKIKISIK